MNHSSNDKLTWFGKEYPDAIKYIWGHATDEDDVSCGACITGKARRNPFVNKSKIRYAPLEEVSLNTTGPISQADISENKNLQLLADAGSGYLSGITTKTNGGVSEAIFDALAKLQILCGQTAQRLHTDNADEQKSTSPSTSISANKGPSVHTPRQDHAPQT